MGVVEYFEGKNVFMTGGSGFVGKVLIEKLLRSCPRIGTVYVLLRPKKGKSMESRLETIKAMPLFDKLREENPASFDKIVPIAGDIEELNLGISEADRRLLIENVHIIYHTAASVRFDDFLKKAIIINVRGTREIAKIALELKNISLFVHVSTTYCNTDKPVVEEKLYPAHTDWRDAIKIAEEGDESLVNTMALKYMDPLPNSYTFAKSLAEHVVNDLCLGKIPTIILRPSVVIPTISEPIPGWSDNFNGPMGLLVAGGKGLLRVVLGNRSINLDYMPVDYIVKGMLVATYKYGSLNRNLEEVAVVNAAQNNLANTTIGEMLDMGAELVQYSPYNVILWYPRFSITGCWYSYFIQVLLFHMLPAFFLDIVLRLVGRKPMLINIQRKIYIANNILFYFMNNSWKFSNQKMLDVMNVLGDEKERQTFGVDLNDFTHEFKFEYFKNGKRGSAIYILKEEFDKEKGKKLLGRLRVLDYTVRTIFFTFVFWYLFCKVEIFRVIMVGLENYFRRLN
ncbi:unnamed protein product [Phyllotreta striolata]|uniref:Fatty acyl-CoA reductase n=1 Tax=Phyllotreta striolata TaxID=444603 RepID=A0A9N9XTA7_PHYSR|nr:unnamed protein product [Phyllotreta striolata]